MIYVYICMNDILDIHKTCCHSGQTADTRQLSKPFSPSVMGGMWTIGFTFAALYCVCVCVCVQQWNDLMRGSREGFKNSIARAAYGQNHPKISKMALNPPDFHRGQTLVLPFWGVKWQTLHPVQGSTAATLYWVSVRAVVFGSVCFRNGSPHY